MGKKITKLATQKQLKKHGYYFSILADIVVFWLLINRHSEEKLTHSKSKTKGEINSF